MSDPDSGAERRRIWIDCDPGHDDALAIILAHEHLDLIGISTVFGNQSVDKTTINALSISALAGIDVPVVRGAAGPLIGKVIDGSDVHGKTGIDGAELPPPRAVPVEAPLATYLPDLLERNGWSIDLIATGPLTNIANLLTDWPNAGRFIKSISLMGGSTENGNVTPAAELNIYADPEAAKLVFESAIPLIMAGLNVTTTVGADQPDIDMLRQSGGRVAAAVSGMLDFYRRRQIEIYDRHIAPFHDPCAVLAFIRPELFTYRPAHVAVETSGELTRGMTVCDFRMVHSQTVSHIRPSKPANTRVAVACASREIVDFVISTIIETDRRLGERTAGGVN